MYKISLYSYKQAKKIGVNIKPSKRKNKKIDVYKGDKYITSIGDSRYLDYPQYKKLFGAEIAENKRKAYKKRHIKDINIKNSAGYYASRILW